MCEAIADTSRAISDWNGVGGDWIFCWDGCHASLSLVRTEHVKVPERMGGAVKLCIRDFDRFDKVSDNYVRRFVECQVLLV